MKRVDFLVSDVFINVLINTQSFFQVITDYIYCLQGISRTCRGILKFHTLQTLLDRQRTEFSCRSFPESMKPSESFDRKLDIKIFFGIYFHLLRIADKIQTDLSMNHFGRFKVENLVFFILFKGSLRFISLRIFLEKKVSLLFFRNFLNILYNTANCIIIMQFDNVYDYCYIGFYHTFSFNFLVIVIINIRILDISTNDV